MTEAKLDPIYNKRPEDPDFIDCINTPLKSQEIAYYLREGWVMLFNEDPSLDSLAILWAQVKLETGSDAGSMCRNWNYGNIKKNKEFTPNWTSYDAGEYLTTGYQLFHPYHPQCSFAAWKTPLYGAIGYLSFLSKRKRYLKAWEELKKGDPVGYCRELRAGGYFTAPLDAYTKVVVKLVNEFKAKAGLLLAWEPEKPKELTTVDKVVNFFKNVLK